MNTSIDYKNLKEITVKSQAEFDAIPNDFGGIIYIDFGTWSDRAVVNRRFSKRVVARGNSSVEAWDNSSVVARGNSSVEALENSSVVALENSSVVAWDNSSVVAWENSSVVARGNSSVVARGNSSVVARENSSVEAWDNSSVVARGNSSVEAWDNSSVVARGNSSVVARGNSSVVARENSSVEAWDNSSVEAWDNSSVECSGNSQTVRRSTHTKIKVSGNARIVEMPKSIHEFMDFYGVKHTNTTATFYKAVHKVNGRYLSDHDMDFEYTIGKEKVEACDTSAVSCSFGIHIAYLDWALRFGSEWNDVAILELTTKISDIVYPEDTDGKVRTSMVKVVREVPLSECGVYGKMLSRKLGRDDG